MLSTFPRIAVAAAVSLATLASTAPAYAQTQDEDERMERTITVSASGEVVAEPDIARIASGITSEAETARKALDANSAAMKKLIEGLKAAGIDPKDIQTSEFRIDPRYTNPREGQVAVIDGYRVTNQVGVVARDLSRLGEILDTLVSLGANQMNGLSFEVSKAETLKDEARTAAVANALRRAKLIAAAAGAEVGKVVSIAEDAPQFMPRAPGAGRLAMAKEVPIERGTETLEARVTVTWELK